MFRRWYSVSDLTAGERSRGHGLSNLVRGGIPPRIVVKEEKKLVFHNRAAEGRAKLVAHQVLPSHNGSREIIEVVIRLETLGSVVLGSRAVPSVGTALGHMLICAPLPRPSEDS